MGAILELIFNVLVEVVFRWAFVEHPFITGFVVLCLIALLLKIMQ
jgi:hypothetical protein